MLRSGLILIPAIISHVMMNYNLTGEAESSQDLVECSEGMARQKFFAFVLAVAVVFVYAGDLLGVLP